MTDTYSLLKDGAVAVAAMRAGTPWGKVAHAYYGGLPGRALCGASVVEPFGYRHASGEVRYEYWGADHDACRKCLRELRKASNQESRP